MLKVNADPNCPGADIRKGDSLHNWDIQHKDRGKFSMASIPKARWQEIFGHDAHSGPTDGNKTGE
jgi:hypothetical protein